MDDVGLRHKRGDGGQAVAAGGRQLDAERGLAQGAQCLEDRGARRSRGQAQAACGGCVDPQQWDSQGTECLVVGLSRGAGCPCHNAARRGLHDEPRAGGSVDAVGDAVARSPRRAGSDASRCGLHDEPRAGGSVD